MKVLITGGTGSFGKGFVDLLLSRGHHVRVYSRCEHKQREMGGKYSGQDIAFYIGDIRDRDRLTRAMDGADLVVHAAALKQAPLGEVEPSEFIKTNIGGSENVVLASQDAGVAKCLLISTDKAVEPINLYGATKMCAERIFLQADRMRGTKKTRFALTRYGNVVGTAGSVVPYFRSLPPGTKTPITHPECTRFWITLADANQFVYQSLGVMTGGEVFIPSMRSVNIVDLANAIRPNEGVQIVGLRPGDKIHESISIDPRLASNDVEMMTKEEILACV